jgi:hypothetical protein
VTKKQNPKFIRAVWLGALIFTNPVTARADGTVLLGLMSVDGPRPSLGVAFSYCPSVAGFEIEYLGTLGGETADHSSAGGIFGSVIVQPVTISRVQFFGIAGFGLWGEKFADGKGTGELGAKNIGGGVKIRIAERLKLRLDYRLFLLGEPEDASRDPSTRHPQRLSAGLHLVF